MAVFGVSELSPTGKCSIMFAYHLQLFYSWLNWYSTSGRMLKHLVAVVSPHHDGRELPRLVLSWRICAWGMLSSAMSAASLRIADDCIRNSHRLLDCGNALLYGFAYKLWRLFGVNMSSFQCAPRLLPHSPLVPIPGERMTVEGCLDGCESAGYNAAALQAGQECCTNTFMTHPARMFTDPINLRLRSCTPERPRRAAPRGGNPPIALSVLIPAWEMPLKYVAARRAPLTHPQDMGRLTSYLTCGYFDLCDVFGKVTRAI
ncbi:hypothetical protein B0H14DRAFT_2650816 [Mycena olivaceomarginata]|nr:hypothetical protein B0H14DRAFT_2650816 [Mycena olivaceomarginata]